MACAHQNQQRYWTKIALSLFVLIIFSTFSLSLSLLRIRCRCCCWKQNTAQCVRGQCECLWMSIEHESGHKSEINCYDFVIVTYRVRVHNIHWIKFVAQLVGECENARARAPLSVIFLDDNLRLIRVFFLVEIWSASDFMQPIPNGMIILRWNSRNKTDRHGLFTLNECPTRDAAFSDVEVDRARERENFLILHIQSRYT